MTDLLRCRVQFSVSDVAHMLGVSRSWVYRHRGQIGFYKAGRTGRSSHWVVLTATLNHYLLQQKRYLGCVGIVGSRKVCIISTDIGLIQTLFRELGIEREPLGIVADAKGFHAADGSQGIPYCLIVNLGSYHVACVDVFETLLGKKRKPRFAAAYVPREWSARTLHFDSVFFSGVSIKAIATDVLRHLQ